MKVELKEKASEIAEEIADETFDLIGSKINGVVDVVEKHQTIQEGIIKSIKRLESKLDSNAHGLEMDVVESERMLSEKFEELKSENEESILRLISDVQDLRDMVISLKSELNRMKQQSPKKPYL